MRVCWWRVDAVFHFPSAQKQCFLLKALLYKLEEIANKTPEMGSGLEETKSYHEFKSEKSDSCRVAMQKQPRILHQTLKRLQSIRRLQFCHKCITAHTLPMSQHWGQNFLQICPIGILPGAIAWWAIIIYRHTYITLHCLYSEMERQAHHKCYAV